MRHNIKILYEDKDIVAIDKPSGLMVHPASSGASANGRSKEETVSDWFVKEYPKSKKVGEPMGEIERPGIVHRLDKDTSGVLLLAKSQKAHEWLKNQFQTREIKKTYIAIVSGWIKEDHNIINKPIGRSPSDFRRRLAGRGARGELREAVTEFTVLKRFTSPQPSPYKGEGEKFSYIEVNPKTGRTHQIRVHMKYFSHPVACDKLYAPNNACPKNISRLALHAKSIEFKNLKGETIKVESPIPADFKKALK